MSEAGISVAEKRLDLGLAALRVDLAVAQFVEPVDHHAVVAGQRLEHRRRLVREHAKRGGVQDGLRRGLQQGPQFDGSPGFLQFDDQAAVEGPVDQRVDLDRRLADAPAHGDRLAMQRRAKMGADARRHRPGQRGDGPPDEIGREIQEFGRVGAGLDDPCAVVVEHQESAMRLDRPGEVDLLAFAVRKIGFAEGRRRGGSQGGAPGFLGPV